jgi:circadian clock protein KaiC
MSCSLNVLESLLGQQLKKVKVQTRTHIRQFPTGVPGLDELLGGGIPEFSLNLIGGAPGSGKTTLAHQVMFSLAGPEKYALFFTTLGEPALKMLRYQQLFPFFDVDKINRSIRFVDLSAAVRENDFNSILAHIVEAVRDFSPQLVFIDSFESVEQSVKGLEPGPTSLRSFIQRLGTTMAGWLITTFLIGEYRLPEAESSPAFAIADGILWLSQTSQYEETVRKIQVLAMRGQAQSPGHHTFLINDGGIEIVARSLLGIR